MALVAGPDECLEAAQRIHEVSAGTKIVALSMYTSAHYQQRMSRSGAASA